MLPDRVSNPGPLTYESGALPIALRGPASARASVIGKSQIGNISAAYANLPIMFFQGIRHVPFEKNVEEGV